MLLEVHSTSLPLPPALQEFTRRHFAPILRPFLGVVAQVDIVLQELYGSPLFDRRCSVTLQAVDTGCATLVREDGAGSRAAIRSACRSVGQMLAEIWPWKAVRPRLGPPAPFDHVRLEPRICVTTLDNDRLRQLIDSRCHSRDQAAAEALLDELDRADIVTPERIERNVVTMNSRLLFREVDLGETHDVSLVYPADSSARQGRISVLASVGSALLGLAEGQTIDWPLPRGRLKRLQVVRLLYQPEAKGHLHL